MVSVSSDLNLVCPTCCPLRLYSVNTTSLTFVYKCSNIDRVTEMVDKIREVDNQNKEGEGEGEDEEEDKKDSHISEVHNMLYTDIYKSTPFHH